MKSSHKFRREKLSIPFLLLFILGIFFITHLSKPIFFRRNSATKNTPITQINISFKPIFDEVVLNGPRTEKKVALSFDADMTFGMQNDLMTGRVKSYYNQKVIEVLSKNNVPATLFISGLWAESYPDETKKLAGNPLFEIGNHSYSHPGFTNPCFNLSPVSEAKKFEEIKKTQDLLEKLTGVKPKLFRFPGGCYKKSDLNLTKSLGLTVVHWDVVGRDAFGKSKDEIINAVKKNVKQGSIIVLHLNGNKNAPFTAEALPEVINYLKENGYNFVKVSEIISSN